MKSDITSAQIKQMRQELGRTQQGMATIVGVSVVTWSRWENGTSLPLPIFQSKLRKLYKYAYGEGSRGE